MREHIRLPIYQTTTATNTKAAMIVEATNRAVSQVLSKPFRAVLWKSIGLTIVMLIVMWFLLQAASQAFLLPLLSGAPWVAAALSWLLGAGLLIGMGFLVAPVTSVFAGVFLDEIAEEVEQTYYPDDPPGRALSVSESAGITLRFFGLVVVGNIIALLLVIFLGLGFIIFFALNGYLLGREYFQFAALRHVNKEEAERLRDKHGLSIFLSGLAIAVVLAIPIVNLLTPLFAGAMMVHVFKWTQSQPAAAGASTN
ncbi:sulfate transporter family protein [Ahrensia sp. R2A130]|uniref:sulfate transporter family protein n=1 Tax=Ahrensia sp. R2A130 TaxID=744979 RepID=UPI0001E0F87B|nr:sulfate transporter family protein [Ahrensia sp. R2A130]EFL89200.1 carbamoyl-phosphate synthase large chain [Ahrensia sp. R2A130]